MTLSKKMLLKWRTEALVKVAKLEGRDTASKNTVIIRDQATKILTLTQELIDQQLVKETK